jgi:hypothetical protein
LTPKFTSYNYHGGEAVVTGEKFTVVGTNADNGAVTLKINNYAITDKSKQDIELTYPGGYTAKIKVTPKLNKPKFWQNTKQISLQRNDVYSDGRVDVAVLTPTAAQITEVKVNGNNQNLFALRKIQNGSYAIGFKDWIISDRIKKSANIKLDIYLAGAAAPSGSVTVKAAIG